MRFGVMIVLMGVLGWGLAACGGDAPTATPQPAATTLAVPGATGVSAAPGATSTTCSCSAPSEQEVDVTLQEFSITPAQITVNAGKVRFVVTNNGALSHNFTISTDSGTLGATPTFAATDSPQVLEVVLKPGTYQTLCSVPGHAQHGQRGMITVK